MALVKDAKVFGIACFVCLGGSLYGYNQGVFSGVLTMNSFKRHEYGRLNRRSIDAGMQLF
ncbi:hypothetical protein GGP41_010746 [Bipolaris sorokiniana]|uniref:Major facilitator superfamily (MFS) profile domain-containing protein n=1 Tax=Cochliobolus sativus TaxID=45130 RepID=A0A8H5ZKT2_COCSA|nr:hypothetical protein GGP41_010746 [Bipolaris sorokiniana]